MTSFFLNRAALWARLKGFVEGGDVVAKELTLIFWHVEEGKGVSLSRFPADAGEALEVGDEDFEALWVGHIF